jgi:hypothetical protein
MIDAGLDRCIGPHRMIASHAIVASACVMSGAARIGAVGSGHDRHSGEKTDATQPSLWHSLLQHSLLQHPSYRHPARQPALHARIGDCLVDRPGCRRHR